MSDIKLTSKEYCESVFVDGPKFDKLSAFVSGPDAQVQGKLTASTGINLNNNTISVNTASSVGTSTLPVTASAVNTKLSSYVNSVSSPDGSITVSKSGSSVTLKANASGGSKFISDDTASNNLILGKGPGGDTANSIFISGPLYDEDGNKITGGGSKWITDGIEDYQTYLSLGADENYNRVNSIFVCGPMYSYDYMAAIKFIGDASGSGILMNVSGSSDTTDSGLILEDGDRGGRLALSPYLCNYYEGPCIGYDGTYGEGSLALVGGEGYGVKIVARDSSGNEKYAYIDYDNIDKLITLLNS